MFYLDYSKKAKKDIERHKKSGNKNLLKKIQALLEELLEHPTFGTGKPERLKHFKNPTYSRRINHEHRLVYEVPEEISENEEEIPIVLILSAFGHYD